MIPHATLGVIRPERRRWRRRLLLVCGAVVIFIYWFLYEHLQTQGPAHTTVKSDLTELQSLTPHDDENLSPAEHSQAESPKRFKDNDTDKAKTKTSVAIGMGISLKGIHVKHPSVHMYLQALPFFSQLVPSFCRTASPGYTYSFYLAHDQDDSFFTKAEKVKIWKETFSKTIQQNCQRLGDVGLNLVRCTHSGRPAWAQNDAMMAAHKDGQDFFYRVNDDSIMITPDWTSIFIHTLQQMKPPLVGVVGPKHSGGNEGILTYDFVHRSHIDIFGYHYPRAFPWWYADDWITLVYLPGRSTKLHNVLLRHTMSVGTRYFNRPKTKDFINGIINSTKEEKLAKYLDRIQPTKNGEIHQSVRSSLPPGSGKTHQSTPLLPTIQSGSRKTPNSTTGPPVSTLPSKSGNTTNSTLPVSTLPSKSGNTTNSTLPGSTLPSKSGRTTNSTLPVSTLPSKSGKNQNATLSLSPLPSGSGKTHQSNLSVSPLSPGSGETANATLPLSPLPSGSGKTPQSTLPGSPLPSGSPKIPNSILQISHLHVGSGKTHQSTLPGGLSPLSSGGGKTHQSTLSVSPLPSGGAKLHQSIFPTQPTRVRKATISFEPSKARKNLDNTPSYQLSSSRKPS